MAWRPAIALFLRSNEAIGNVRHTSLLTSGRPFCVHRSLALHEKSTTGADGVGSGGGKGKAHSASKGTGKQSSVSPATSAAATASVSFAPEAVSALPIAPLTPQQPPQPTPMPAVDASSQTEGAAGGSSTTTSESSGGSQWGASPQKAVLVRLFTSWQQGVVASIGAVMGIGFLVYFLYAPVKEDTVHHTAVVASEALSDMRLKTQAIQLSKDVVEEVLNDPKSLRLVVNLVVQLLAQDDTRIAVSSLLQSLFEDHYTQEVTKKFVLMIVRDPWIQDQIQVIVKEQVLRLLQDSEIKQALSQFLLNSATESLKKPELHYEAARAVRHSVASLFNPWWQ